MDNISFLLDIPIVRVGSVAGAIVEALEFLCELSDVACGGPFCVVCGNHSRLVCATCEVANYCARRCQKIHWRHQHKRVCTYLRDWRIARDLSGTQLAATSFRSNVMIKVQLYLNTNMVVVI